MQIAPQVQELVQLLGNDVLLLPWAWGTKGGKRRWKHLTAAAMRDPAHLRKLAEGNIGVALGAVSCGLCSLDIDSDTAMKEFVALNPEISNTLLTRGARGCNFWWRLVGDYPPLTTLKKHGQPWGEWRSTGSQTIIYGQHPEGHGYKITDWVKPIQIELIQIKWPEGINPLLQGGSLVSDTERTEITELPELSEPSEVTERMEVNISGKHVCGRFPTIMNHDQAVRASLPTEQHQNHQCLFTLARAIKALGLEEGREIGNIEMKKIFIQWHSQAMPFLDPSQSQDDYWFELLDAHANATHALGVDVIAVAWSNIQSKPPPTIAEQFTTPEIRKLVSLCRELQVLNKDGPFFLSTRSVQRLFGLPTPMSASRWLKGLCRSKILEVVVQGGNDTKRATRFFYLPPI